MSHQRTVIPPLSVLLPTMIVLWVVSVVLVIGEEMLTYFFAHLAITGLFAVFMWRAEKNAAPQHVDDSAQNGKASGTAVEPNQTPTQVLRSSSTLNV